MACKGVNKPTVEDRSKQDFLVIRNGKLEIVQGVNTKCELDLTSFFVAADEFFSQTIDLKAGEELLLNPGNVKGNGEVQFIGLFVTYPDDVLEIDEYINFVYPNLEIQSSPPLSPPLSGQTMNIGKIMMLSGSQASGKGWDLLEGGSPVYGGLKLINPQIFDVIVNVLIVK